LPKFFVAGFVLVACAFRRDALEIAVHQVGNDLVQGALGGRRDGQSFPPVLASFHHAVQSFDLPAQPGEAASQLLLRLGSGADLESFKETGQLLEIQYTPRGYPTRTYGTA
jgi:hypothetical protein